MDFIVLRASNPDERDQWRTCCSALPPDRRDVYFLPEYLLASESDGRGAATCAVCRDGDALWLYPFLVSPIADPAVPSGDVVGADLASAYGYGGPVVTHAGEDPGFLTAAAGAFSDWARTAGIVGEFVRFHPLLDNARWAPPETRVVVDRQTVQIDLAAYPTAWLNDSYYRVHRGMVRKAERAGFVFEVLTDPTAALEWFTRLYDDTQDALGAGSETRFGVAYFQSLISGLRERAWLGVVKQTDTVLAAVLVLEGETMAHCHLMGYQRREKTAGMTNLVYHGIALEAARRGRFTLHMGGGRTAAADDSLLKFKRSLSPARATFAIGMRCHNWEAYDALAARWEAVNGARPAGYFLFYRLRRSDLASTISSSAS